MNNQNNVEAELAALRQQLLQRRQAGLQGLPQMPLPPPMPINEPMEFDFDNDLALLQHNNPEPMQLRPLAVMQPQREPRKRKTSSSRSSSRSPTKRRKGGRRKHRRTYRR